MRPVTVLLLALLLVSNFAWGLAHFAGWSTTESAAPGRESALAEEVAELREENTRLRLTVENSANGDAAASEKTGSSSSKPAPATARRREPDPLQIEAAPLMKSWVADAMQLTDPGKRDAALAELRHALGGDDPARYLAGLQALCSLHQLDFDKASLRPLILPAFTSEHALIRATAIYALNVTGRQPADLDLVLAMIDDPAPKVRSRLSQALCMYSGGDLSGPAGAAMLKLLEAEDPRELKEVFRGIGGKLSPEVAARLIEHGRNPKTRYDVIYFALSRVQKDEAVVEFLIEAAQDPDSQVRYYGVWGLGWGVLPEAQPKVAEAFLAILESRNDSQSVDSALRAISQYGDESHADRFSRWASGSGLPEATAKRAEDIEKQIRARDRR